MVDLFGKCVHARLSTRKISTANRRLKITTHAAQEKSASITNLREAASPVAGA